MLGRPVLTGLYLPAVRSFREKPVEEAAGKSRAQDGGCGGLSYPGAATRDIGDIGDCSRSDLWFEDWGDGLRVFGEA